jgi:hypothetical protein
MGLRGYEFLMVDVAALIHPTGLRGYVFLMVISLR